MDKLIDQILERVGIQLAPELREEFGTMVVGQILERAIVKLGMMLTEQEREEIASALQSQEHEDIVEHLIQKYPQLQEMILEEADTMIEDLRVAAQRLS